MNAARYLVAIALIAGCSSEHEPQLHPGSLAPIEVKGTTQSPEPTPNGSTTTATSERNDSGLQTDDLRERPVQIDKLDGETLEPDSINSRLIDGGELGQTPGVSYQCDTTVLADSATEPRGVSLFATNEATLTPQAKARLKTHVIPFLDGAAVVLVVGHTDARGNTTHNQELSEQRALSVKTYLSQFAPRVSIDSRGEGSTELSSSGDSAEAHAANRRVEVFICVDNHA